METNAISGTMMDCLRHYRRGLPKDRDHVKQGRLPLVTFLGLGDRAVQEILGHDHEPIGEARIKLRYFLWHRGYTVNELLDLRPEVLQLGDAFALGSISIQDIASELGCSRDHALAFLSGRAGISSALLGKVRQFLATYQEQPEIVSERLQLCGSVRRVNGTDLATMSEKSETKVVGNGGSNTVVPLLGKLIEAALPLAEYVLSDACTPGDRRKLREMTCNGVFDLSNALTGLCSETARKRVLESNVAQPQEKV